MTICIAGIHRSHLKKETVIIAAFDRKLSSFGGWHSSDGNAWKMRDLGRGWTGLIAGSVSEMTAIADAVKNDIKPKVFAKLNWRDYSRACASAYKAERKRLVESEILSQYDVDSYGEYLSLKSTKPDLFEAIETLVRAFDEKLHLLMCGFDRNREPHIFTISGSGKINYCDLPGYAVIGSGEVAAAFALDRYAYDPWQPVGDCLYGILAAKFAAESADGVGKDTAFFIFRSSSTRGEGIVLSSAKIEEVKDKWKAIPRIPDGVAVHLQAELAKFEHNANLRKRMRRLPRKGETMPSTSHMSEDQP